jgi:hypothetical protein
MDRPVSGKDRLKRQYEGKFRKIFYATSQNRHRHVFTRKTR